MKYESFPWLLFYGGMYLWSMGWLVVIAFGQPSSWNVLTWSVISATWGFSFGHRLGEYLPQRRARHASAN